MEGLVVVEVAKEVERARGVKDSHPAYCNVSAWKLSPEQRTFPRIIQFDCLDD